MKLLRIVFLLFTIIVVFASCRQYRYVYAASKINTPMLREKGDSRLNTSFSSGNARGRDSSQNLGLDVQVAYALSRHWGLMASFYRRWEKDHFVSIYNSPFTDSYIDYNRSNWELGTGYFIAQKSTAFSVFGGVSTGQMSAKDIGFAGGTKYSRDMSVNSTKYFLQPAFTIGRAGTVRFDLSMRFALLDFSNAKHNYTNEELDYFNIRRTLSNATLFSRETSFTLSIPIPSTDWMQFETSYSAISVSQTSSARRWNFSVGLTADLQKAIKPQNK